MWEQYKKTLFRIQSLILVVTLGVFFATGHRLPAAAVFFVVMQIGAAVGAMWAVRLKRKVEIYR